MKYQVTVRRKEHREHVFEVEADSREEAEDKALEKSCDHDFGQNTVHYADEDVTFVSEPNAGGMARELAAQDSESPTK